MSTTLPLFWKLSSASKKDRIDASVKLINTLEQFQEQHVPRPDPDGFSSASEHEEDSDEGGDGLDVLNAPDVSYSIRRLVRGLASPRESSRLGFSVALTELLSRLETVTCAQVVRLIVRATKKQKSMNGQEERDVLFARLFGIAAVVRSGLIVRPPSLGGGVSSSSSSSSSSASALSTTGTPVSSLETFASILKLLLEIGDAKSWLRESAWWTIGLAVDTLSASSVPWKNEALGLTIQAIFPTGERDGHGVGAWTPDKIAMTLKLQPLTPKHDWEGTLAPAFKSRNVFAKENLVTLGRIMKESAVDDDEDVVSNPNEGTWKAQLHVAWDLILERLFPPTGSECAPQGSFSDFFRIVVDETLFSPSSSSERKYWGFQVFKKALVRTRADELPMLFTKNLMRSWITHLSNKDRYLHKMAVDVARHVQAVMEATPALGLPLVLLLTGANGNRQFDKLTRTKTVESILTIMDSAGIQSYVLSLLEQVNSAGDAKEEPSATDSRRMWIADQFAALVRNGSIPRDDGWIQIVLDFYVVHGLFVVCKKSQKSPVRPLHTLPMPPFTEAVQSHCREKLLGCLGVLNAQVSAVKRGEHTRKECGVASDGEFWLSRTLATVARLEKDVKYVKALVNVDEQVQASLAAMKDIIAQLKKTEAEDNEREIARGCELILSSLLLQCHCGEVDGLDNHNLEATLEAVRKLFPSEPKKSHKKKTKSTQPATLSEDEPSPIDVLVDVIIGFLEKANAFTRSVANESFSRVTSAVQGSTVDLILNQLERRNPSELVDEDEEMVDGGSDDGTIGNQEGEGKEKGDSEEEEDDDDEDDDESSGDDEESEEGDSEGDEEDAAQVRKKIEDALKANGMDVQEEGDEAKETSDEELMDDEQMMALDDTLAEIFRTRASNHKGVNAQRDATYFKNRVLDLVDVFIKREPTSPLNVRLVLPLIDLATKSSTDERQLSDKASGILRSRLTKSKDLPTTALRDEIEPVLLQVHRRARRSHAATVPDAVGLLSQASLYLCRILFCLAGERDVDVVLKAYRESLDDYALRKASQLSLSFFQDFARRLPTMGWRLLTDVLGAASKAINAYRKCQMIQLLQVILSQADKDEDAAVIEMFQMSLQKMVLELITRSIDDDHGLSTAQTKDVLKVVLFCIRQSRKAEAAAAKESSSSSTDQVWDPAAWKALHDRMSSSGGRFKGSTSVLNMCRQVVDAVTPVAVKRKQVVNGKRKAESEVKDTEEAAGIDPSEKSSRKKQKKK